MVWKFFRFLIVLRFWKCWKFKICWIFLWECYHISLFVAKYMILKPISRYKCLSSINLAIKSVNQVPLRLPIAFKMWTRRKCIQIYHEVLLFFWKTSFCWKFQSRGFYIRWHSRQIVEYLNPEKSPKFVLEINRSKWFFWETFMQNLLFSNNS